MEITMSKNHELKAIINRQPLFNLKNNVPVNIGRCVIFTNGVITSRSRSLITPSLGVNQIFLCFRCTPRAGHFRPHDRWGDGRDGNSLFPRFPMQSGTTTFKNLVEVKCVSQGSYIVHKKILILPLPLLLLWKL